VPSDVDPKETAVFLVAVYEGYLGLAKFAACAGAPDGKEDPDFPLESLRPSA
jgi:hypothetical protein